jgi:hypothetical protein
MLTLVGKGTHKLLIKGGPWVATHWEAHVNPIESPNKHNKEQESQEQKSKENQSKHQARLS